MNEALANRLRRALAGRKAVSEKRMFGGICFLLRGDMPCGTGRTDFMFRLAEPYAGMLRAKRKP